MADSDDPICFTLGMLRFLGDDVASTLSERGWAVADPDVVPLEWFWPPTAPVGYGGLPEMASETMRKRPHLFGPRHTPWTAPTRLTKTGTTWTLEYGKAIAKSPDAPRAYADEAELRADLERIECWPMPVDEAKRLRAERIVAVTTAIAHDNHYLAVFPTDPPARGHRQPSGHRPPPSGTGRSRADHPGLRARHCPRASRPHLVLRQGTLPHQGPPTSVGRGPGGSRKASRPTASLR
ncbi:hypothetical protein [Streptomyces sp. ISL-10]|uniref:hypothetical protein n=1 Tax=Streptomyces sp. ISL-10 TaxID=2819172 RepID=UPI002035C287|nr:hypothetical protein [Streptomyces sp. ISL-10]